MYTNRNKIVSILLSALMAAGNITPALASSRVTLTIEVDDHTEIIDISVPAVIQMSMDSTGNITVKDGLELVNLSSENAVKLTELTVEGLNNWDIKDYNTDFSETPENTKHLALEFNGDKTVDGGEVDLTDGNWEIGESQSLDLVVKAKAPLQTEQSNGEIANVEYTFELIEEAILCDKCGDEVSVSNEHKRHCGHYTCVDDIINHEDADCGVAGHYNCDELNHMICDLCSQPKCEGEHGLGECSETELNIQYTNSLMVPGSENVAQVSYNNASIDSIKSITYDDSIATVDVISTFSNTDEKMLLVTGVSRGTTTVTIELESGKKGEFTVEVTELDPEHQETQNIQSEATLTDGTTSEQIVNDILDGADINISVIDKDGDSAEVTAPITADNIVGVENVTVGPGNNEIDVTLNINGINVIITVNIFVRAPLERLELDKDMIRLNLTDRTSDSLSVVYLPSYTTDDKTVTWESANDSIATVDENGVVTAVGAGETVIRATCGECSDTCSVVVEDGINVTITLLDTDYATVDGEKTYTIPNGGTLTLPSVTVAENFFFEKWVNIETGETVDNNTVFTSGATIQPVTQGMFETDGNGTLLGYSAICKSVGGQLENLAIPSEIDGEIITKIGDSAFENEIKTKTLTIPDTVTSVGTKAFQGLYQLEEISLSENTETLGDYALAGCFNLEEIELPETLEKVGNGAFKRTGIYTIDLKNVSKVGSYAFESCRNIGNIDYGEADLTMGDAVFRYCRNITDFVVGDNVVSLGSNILAGCNNVKSVTLGQSVKSIGQNAFASLPSLEEITLGPSLENIGNYAFQGNDKLRNIDFNNCKAIGVGMFHYLPCITEVNIPGTVTKIGNNAFQECRGLTSVTLGDGVEEIGEYAFNKCYNISSINIPDSVSSIGQSALCELYKIDNLYIPSSVTSIGNSAFFGILNITHEDSSNTSDYGARAVNRTPENGFIYSDDRTTLLGCVSSKSGSVSIPSGVESIYEYAFAGCDKITSVTLPNTVTYMDYGVFMNCESLTNVTLPTGLTSIPNLTFSKCKSLQSVTIPSTVKSIGGSAFAECEKLTTVTNIDKVSYINNGAFKYCKSLKKVNLSSAITISTDAFDECSNLTSVTFSSALKKIDKSAFSDCISLWGVSIPSSVTTLSNNCFYNVPYVKYSGSLDASKIGCTALNGYEQNGVIYDSSSKKKLIVCNRTTSGEFTVPSSVTEIGSNAFQYCDKLTGISIPDSVKLIGDCTFTYCSNLQYIDFPSSFTFDAYWSMAYCNNLKEIDLSGVTEFLSMHYFARNNATLENIILPNSMTEIHWNSFRENPKLKKLIMPENITSIGSYLVWDDPSLTEIKLNNKLESMDDGALNGCAITEITLPASLETMKGIIFSNCADLQVIYVEGKSSEAEFENCANNWNDNVAVVYLGD